VLQVQCPADEVPLTGDNKAPVAHYKH